MFCTDATRWNTRPCTATDGIYVSNLIYGMVYAGMVIADSSMSDSSAPIEASGMSFNDWRSGSSWECVGVNCGIGCEVLIPGKGYVRTTAPTNRNGSEVHKELFLSADNVWIVREGRLVSHGRRYREGRETWTMRGRSSMSGI